MNKNDSELMNSSMAESGFIYSEKPETADIVIFNTCSVRQNAENRAMARINAIKSEIKKRDGLIVLAGCMAQRIGQELINDNFVDIVIGPYQSPDIGRIVGRYIKHHEEKIYLSQEQRDFSQRINFDLAVRKELLPWHKWVTITHGCNNFCSYCIVPYVRGSLISFPSESILKYVKELTKKNITEITLLGQNVNQYGMDSNDMSFPALLDKIAENSSLQRINFITSHPKDFSDDIIQVISNYDNISRNIHLPLQSGSDRILQLMNRDYTIEKYYKIMENINKLLDDYSISTDIIVGFPGETETDFNDTLEAVKNIQFDDAFMYAYSPREGTPAFHLKEYLLREEKIQRLNRLIDIQRKISREKLNTRINCTEKIIVETLSKKSKNEVMGKTFLNHPVITPGEESDIGKKLLIKITSIKGNTLYGERTA